MRDSRGLKGRWAIPLAVAFIVIGSSLYFSVHTGMEDKAPKIRYNLLPDVSINTLRQTESPDTKGPSNENILTGPQGELSFVFVGWNASETSQLQAMIDQVYPLAKDVFGPPFSTITVTIEENASMGSPGSYNPPTNTIKLRTLSKHVLAHEMLHAFRDDFHINLDTFEEGMARSLQHLLGGDFQGQMSSENYVYHESLNREEIAPEGGEFTASSRLGELRLMRYDLSGYVWAKIYIEDSTFYKRFNERYFDNVTTDTGSASNESLLVEIVSSLASVEDMPYGLWYSSEHVLNVDPPEGNSLAALWYFWTVRPLHIERDFFGGETLVGTTIVDISMHSFDGTLLNETSINSGDWYFFLPDLPYNYTGRIRFDLCANVPGNPMNQTLYGFNSSEGREGVFGVVANRDGGTVSLFHNGTAIEKPLTNASFIFPEFSNDSGVFVLNLTTADGLYSKTFTKGPGPYFVLMDAIPPVVLASSNTTHNSTRLSWNESQSSEFHAYALYEIDEENISRLLGYWQDPSSTSVALDLLPSRNYSFVLRTISKSRSYSLSNVVHVQTPPTPPLLLEPAHEDLSQDSANLDWEIPDESLPTLFRVYMSESGGELGVLKLTLGNGSARSAELGGLEQARGYFATVEVQGKNGLVSFSNQMEFITLPSPPSLNDPANVTNESAYLQWTAPDYDVFLRYEVFLSHDENASGYLAAATDNMSDRGYELSGLLPSTVYYATVKAVSSNTSYSWSEHALFATTPSPVEPRVLSTNSNGARIGWEPNSDANFSRYEVYVSTNSDEIGELHATIYNQSIDQWDLDGLAEGKKHWVTVRVINTCSTHVDSTISFTTSSLVVPVALAILLVVFTLLGVFLIWRMRRRKSAEGDDSL